MTSNIAEIERTYQDSVAERFNKDELKLGVSKRLKEITWKYIMPLLTGKTLLDIGCGLGFDSILFAKLGYKVMGVDISPISIQKAKILSEEMEVSDKTNFLVANIDVDQIPGKFDIVLCRSVLHHLTTYSLEESIKKIKSCLVPSGRAIFIEPLDKNPLANINRTILDPYDRSPTEKPLNLSRTLDAFKSCFKYVRHRELALFSGASYFFHYRWPALYETLQKILDDIDNFLLRIAPKLREYAWITIIDTSDVL